LAFSLLYFSLLDPTFSFTTSYALALPDLGNKMELRTEDMRARKEI
jgi:hypothetical protein